MTGTEGPDAPDDKPDGRLLGPSGRWIGLRSDMRWSLLLSLGIPAVGLIVAVVVTLVIPAARVTRSGGGDAGHSGAAATEADGGERSIHGRIAMPSGWTGPPPRVEAIDAAGDYVASAEAGADGSYGMDAAADRIAALLVSADGLPSRVARVEGGDRIDVAMQAGATLAVRVVDDAGTPIPGALVMPDPMDGTLGEGERRALGRADSRRTGDRGEATLAVSPDLGVQIVAEAEGHVPGRSDTLVPPFSAPVVVELPRGGKLVGLVLAAEGGSGAAGARVRVVGSGLWPVAQFATDASGRFSTGLVPPGFYEAEAVLGDAVSALATGIEVRPAADTEVRLDLRPGGRLAGRVAAESGARPAAEWSVALQGAGSRLVPVRATPDAGGRFSFGPLVPGRYMVRAGAPSLLGAEAWLDVAGGETATVDLVLRPGRTLAGRVVGPGGVPVPGAEVTVSGLGDDGSFVFRSPTTEAIALLGPGLGTGVGRLLPIGELGVMEGPLPPIPAVPFGWLENRGAPGRAPEPEAPPAGRLPPAGARPSAALTTDGDGRFLCDALPPGRFALAVVHPDFAPAIADATVGADAPRTSVEIALGPGCSLSGSVRDEQGEAVPGATVWLAPGGRLPPRVVRSDAAGAFRAEHLPAKVLVRVLSRGFSTSESTIEIRGTPCAGTADVMLATLGGAVAGRVIDARRFPVAGARVRVEREGGGARWPGQETWTAPDGTFSVAAPRDGVVRAVASHPDYVEGSAVGAAGDPIEIVLSRGVSVAGAVADDTGAPVGATVTMLADGGTVAVRPTAPDGTFDMGRVAPGAYEFRASSPGFADASVLVGVADRPDGAGDATVRVDIRVRRGVTLAGRVVDRFGGPVPDAAVSASHAGSRSPPREARSGPDGGFEISGLDAGRWRVEASRDDLGSAAADVTLDVGTRGRPVEIVFREAAPAPVPAPESVARVGYSTVNDQVFVSRRAAYSAPGTDPLEEGDTIVQVERTRIRDTEALGAVLAGIRRATVSVAVERAGRRRFLTVDRESMMAEGW